MSNGDDTAPRPTTASIDRRVERLEVAHGEMQRTIDRMELGMAHLRELVNARFSSIDNSLSAQSARIDSGNSKLDGLIVSIQTAIVDGTKIAGDIESTPAGRAVKARMDELEALIEKNADRTLSVEKKVWTAAGAVSVLAILSSVVVQVILYMVQHH